MKDQIKTALALVLVGALGYVVYVQVSGQPLLPVGIPTEPPPEPDTSKLAALKEVANVKAGGMLAGAPEYHLGGRNLFQYGVFKPPPPSPAELENIRRMEEARLKAMEEEARARAEEQAKNAQDDAARRARETQEAMARAQEQQKAQPAAAPPPVASPPPAINYKLAGFLGPQNGRIAVFLSGNEIVLGKQGEVIDGKFRVLSIGPESVEMGYTDPAHKDARKKIDLGS